MQSYQDLDAGRYPTVTDFVEAMKQAPRNKANESIWQDVGFDGGGYDASWFGAGCNNGNEVQKLVMEGWPEGRQRMNDLRDKMGTLDAQPVDRRRRQVWGAHGSHVNMQRVWAGDVTHAWRSAKRRNVRGPQHVEICANMICHGGEHPDVLFWRGAAAIVLLDVLEAAGYQVRLVVGFGGRHWSEKRNDGRVSCRITVKDYGTPLDITSTSSVILPGFFRSLGHAWICNHALDDLGGCGISVEQGDVEPSEVLISHNVRDHATALAWVNSTIEAVNNGTLAAA